MKIEAVASHVEALSAQFASEGQARRERRNLEREDFDNLVACGLHLTGLPVAQGGLWRSPSANVREFASLYRTLARGDASVALVSTMHPSVLAFWLHGHDAPPDVRDAWQQQLADINDAVRRGQWFGTIASEPGSNGDLMATRASAVRDGEHWLMTGDKHMGSGSGMTSYADHSARC